MGIHPKLELQQSAACLETDPGLPSPVSAASLPSVSEDKAFGRTAPISPPMSSHESRTQPNMRPRQDEHHPGQERRETRNEPARQQLPPLSSLLAQVEQPVQSPLSPRRSLHGTESALHRSGVASIHHTEGSHYTYFTSPTQNRPRPVYEPRITVDRPTLPSVSQSFPGPLSPPIREYDQAHHIPRSDAGAGGRWPQATFPDPGRIDYFYHARPSTPTFRPMGDHRATLPTLAESLGISRASRSSTSPRSSIGAVDGHPVKDGLGPRIWSGGQFLPRFVRSGEVPGEGSCYFYDDGSHCKAMIDGEAVNAHWGVTKAGKPRKRLAIACVTCREKKIKCDPDFPRCMQCEKFGRTCKFKNAPRGGHNTSPATSPNEQDNSRQLGAPQRISELDRPRSVSSNPMSPLSKMRRASPELPSQPLKRPRLAAYEGYAQFQPPQPPPPTSSPYTVWAGEHWQLDRDVREDPRRRRPWQIYPEPRPGEDERTRQIPHPRSPE
ncbi:hypothetical protein F4802DRAFT_279809 [Xylaria palmicola]|nr:hypothetical protein F4802DRAFT_279809 [Xylaria palmicola]